MLKSLELFGFKSFADKIVFDFSRGITGVVGPNGSGKSNVVDAIKWILGDQSAKSLRGKEMTDVIFNGSSSRKPNAFSEAALTFDNSEGFLPIELQEVKVGRRLWRNGDSEYLINDNPARLKDVRNLFVGTGASASSYSIIEQGRVDQILQTNPTNRRAVFEEAAGISRYKSRKNEALRKLDRVDQNVLRLTDIVDEVSAQLNSMRNQAQKAAKFRAASVELRELWIGLAADDYRRLSVELEEIRATESSKGAELEKLTEQQQGMESRLSAMDEDINAVDDRLRVVERESSDLQRTIASHEATIRHESERRQEIESDLVRLRRQRAMMETRLAEAQDELLRTQSVLDNQESAFVLLENNVTDHEAHIRHLTESIASGRQFIEQGRDALLEKMRVHTALDGRLTGIVSQHQSIGVARDSTQDRLLQLGERLGDAVRKFVQHETHVRAAEHSVLDAETEVDRILQSRENKAEEQTLYQKRLADLREKRSGAQARKSVLEDLEAREEGFGIGVRDILKRARTSDHAPWTSIKGSVAELLDVDLDHAALIEVALGNRAQLIVLDEIDPLIEYLNSGRCAITGRVGFVAIGRSGEGLFEAVFEDDITSPETSVLRAPVNPVDLKEESGVVSRADGMAHGSTLSRRLALHLLHDTWIVRTLDDAIRLARGRGAGCRFVTLQGELLENNGILYAGTVRSESAVMSRKSELRRLRKDLDQIDEEIAAEERRLLRLADSINSVDEELLRARQNVGYQREQLNRQQLSLEECNRQREKLKVDETDIAEELQQLLTADSDLSVSVQTLQNRLQETNAEIEQTRQRVSETELQTSTEEQELQRALQARTSEQLKLAKHEERLTSLRLDFDRLQSDVELRKQQFDESVRRLNQAETQFRRLTLNVLNTRAIVDEYFLRDDESSVQAAELLREKSALREQRAAVVAEENTIRKERRALSDAHHAMQIQLRDVTHQIESMQERISEEYQVELADVVEEGASAFQIWLQENQPEPEPVAESESSEEGSFDSFAAGLLNEANSSEENDVVNCEANEDDAQFETDATSPDSESITADTESEAFDSASDETPEAFDDASAAATSEQAADVDAESATEPLIDDASGLVIPDDFDPETVRTEIEERVNRLRKRIRKMGNVNTESLDSLEELEGRYNHMNSQLTDLMEARNSLEEIVKRINVESRRLFKESYDSVRGHFQELFRRLFGGGEGDIILEDPEDILECGIDIVARPPGKELRSISLLSGGEKTLTAVAMSLAIFKSRPSPFCILDEVDAALDDANIDRFIKVLKVFSETTQFIMITHRKPTMAVADVLYGVTMEESGVSKRLSVRFDEVTEDGEFRRSADSSEQREAA